MVIFLPYVKYFGNKIGIHLSNTFLVIEQINYAKRVVDVYIVYDFDNWLKKSPKKFYTKKLFLWSD